MAKSGGKSGGRSGDATRAALVAAATDALREVGFAGASAREIARRANCQQSLVFYHFGSVSGVLLAALDAVSQRRLAAYQALVADSASADDLLGAAADIIATDLASGDVAVLVEMLAGARLVPGLAQQVSERLAIWQEFAQAAMARLLPPGPLSSLAPVPDVAHTVVAGILGLELLAHTSGDRETPARILDQAAGGLAVLEVLTRRREPKESP